MNYWARPTDIQNADSVILYKCGNTILTPSFLFCKTMLIINTLHGCLEVQMRSHIAQNIAPSILRMFLFFNEGNWIESEENQASNTILVVPFIRKLSCFKKQRLLCCYFYYYSQTNMLWSPEKYKYSQKHLYRSRIILSHYNWLSSSQVRRVHFEGAKPKTGARKRRKWAPKATLALELWLAWHVRCVWKPKTYYSRTSLSILISDLFFFNTRL